MIKRGINQEVVVRFVLLTLIVFMGCYCFNPKSISAQEVELRVISPLPTDTVELAKGEPYMKTLQVKNATDQNLNIKAITFRPASPNAPKEANEVKVTGLHRVTLAKGEWTNISVFFPKHSQEIEYEGSLYYVHRDKPTDHIPFYSLKVQVIDPSPPLMNQMLAGLAAFVLSLFVLIVTLWMQRKGIIRLGFFQAPDGSYSVSKFQIWLWTLVIIYSFVYVFLRRGAVVEFPESVGWLLGISIGSTGTAKFIAVRRTRRKATTMAIPGQPMKQPRSLVEILASMLSEKEQLSLMRLQMFGWTVVTALLFIVHVFRTEMLWNVPVGLLVLMGISHLGYLGDKGATPDVALKFDSLAPKAMKATETQNANLLIFGQNFEDGTKCHLDAVELTVDPNILPNRIIATLPAQGLPPGKYDLSVQNLGERVVVVKDAFEVN